MSIALSLTFGSRLWFIALDFRPWPHVSAWTHEWPPLPDIEE